MGTAPDPRPRGRDLIAAGGPRARDEAGRPLPRGSGSPPPGEPVFVDAATSLSEADRLLAAGRPFFAHEVLEAAWKATADDGRELWRALAQLTVGLTHAQRGNSAGAVALLRRAAEGLGEYAGTAPYDVEVDRLRETARRLAAAVEADGTSAVDVTSLRLRGS